MTERPKRRDPLQLLDQLTEVIGTEQARLVTHPDPRNAELAPPPALLDAIKAVRAAIAELQDTVDLAWGVIANAGDGDWSRESDQWREAAARWRDDRYLPAGDLATSDHDRKLDQILAGLATVSNLARELWGPEAVNMTLTSDSVLLEGGGQELADRIMHTSSPVQLERKRDDDTHELEGGPANG